MNAMNRFYTCPRCDEPWSKLAYTKCDNCGMVHNFSDHEEELFLNNLINEKDSLIWRFHFNDCLYCYDAASPTYLTQKELFYPGCLITSQLND